MVRNRIYMNREWQFTEKFEEYMKRAPMKNGVEVQIPHTVKEIKLVGLKVTDGATVADQSMESLIGLRLIMTVLPAVGLFGAIIVFHKKYKLDEETLQDIMHKIRGTN